MYSALFPSIDDAAKHFAAKRSSTAKGVTQPSQVRYLTYYSNTLLAGQEYPRQRYTIVSIFFGPVPKQFSEFSVQILAYHGATSDEIFSADYTKAQVMNENYYQMIVGVPVMDDVLIRFYNTRKASPKKLFHIVFHTAFLNSSDHDICFGFRDLDNPSKKLSPSFTFSCEMKRLPETMEDLEAGPDPSIMKMCQTYLQRVRRKSRMVGTHRGQLEISAQRREIKKYSSEAVAKSVASSSGAASSHWHGRGRGESVSNETSKALSLILDDFDDSLSPDVPPEPAPDASNTASAAVTPSVIATATATTTETTPAATATATASATTSTAEVATATEAETATPKAATIVAPLSLPVIPVPAPVPATLEATSSPGFHVDAISSSSSVMPSSPTKIYVPGIDPAPGTTQETTTPRAIFVPGIDPVPQGQEAPPSPVPTNLASPGGILAPSMNSPTIVSSGSSSSTPGSIPIPVASRTVLKQPNSLGDPVSTSLPSPPLHLPAAALALPPILPQASSTHSVARSPLATSFTLVRNEPKADASPDPLLKSGHQSSAGDLMSSTQSRAEGSPSPTPARPTATTSWRVEHRVSPAPSHSRATIGGIRAHPYSSSMTQLPVAPSSLSSPPPPSEGRQQSASPGN